MVQFQRLSFAIVLGGVLIAGGACRSSPAAPDDPSLSGTYATHVTLVQDGCGGTRVQDNSTLVTHNVETSAITLQHGGQAYFGTVKSDKTFTTAPGTVDVGDGFIYVITLAGQFGTGTFTADVTVDRSANGVTCRYLVHWVGTRV